MRTLVLVTMVICPSIDPEPCDKSACRYRSIVPNVFRNFKTLPGFFASGKQHITVGAKFQLCSYFSENSKISVAYILEDYCEEGGGQTPSMLGRGYTPHNIIFVTTIGKLAQHTQICYPTFAYSLCDSNHRLFAGFALTMLTKIADDASPLFWFLLSSFIGL